MLRRIAIAVVCCLPIAGLTGLFLYRLGKPAFHEFTAAEARGVAPTLERAAERDDEFLGVPARSAFCQVRAVGSDLPLDSGEQRFVYASANCDEIGRASGGDLAFGSGVSVEARFTVVGRGDDLRVRNVELPGDGSDYGPDLERLLPAAARSLLKDRARAGNTLCDNLRTARERWQRPGAKLVDRFDASSGAARCPSG